MRTISSPKTQRGRGWLEWEKKQQSEIESNYMVGQHKRQTDRKTKKMFRWERKRQTAIKTIRQRQMKVQTEKLQNSNHVSNGNIQRKEMKDIEKYT